MIAGAITGMAIFIGAMGLFGMSMYVLKRIRREFAIRKANGAQVDHIVRLLARNYLILVISTLIMASPLEVLLLNRWLQNFVFRTTISWWIFFLTCGIALVILPVPQGIIYSGQLPKIHLKTSDTNNVLTSR